MTTVILLLATLTGAGWLLLSPVRLASLGAVLLVTHPVSTFAITTVLTLTLIAIAARIIYRSLHDGGWHLLTVGRPAYAVSRAGGMAS